MNSLQSHQEIVEALQEFEARLVVVSKTRSVSDILSIYGRGQRIFGENRVQELVQKVAELPQDIEWHMIGHLQRNKVKLIAPFVHMIQSVDSVSLLKEIDKQANRCDRRVEVLLQIKIAREESKYGMEEIEIDQILRDVQAKVYPNIVCRGLMAMATFTDDVNVIRNEFRAVKSVYNKILHSSDIGEQFDTLSMGMSGDYDIALEEGSTMVRVGSKIFGPRKYS